MDIEQFGIGFEEELLENVTPNLSNSKIHIRIQQINGKKSITSATGIPSNQDFEKMLRTLKKSLSCNGCIKTDTETGGNVIQLQGDKRVSIRDYLIDKGICLKEDIIIHGSS